MTELSLDHIGLPFSPERIKVGYEFPQRYESDDRLAMSILRGQSNLIQLGAQYLDSYTKATSKTSLHYRDYLVFKAIEILLKQTQLKNPSTLTPLASKVWFTFTYDDIWPYISPEDPIPEYRYWGPLGTLAYYAQYTDPNTPVTLLRSILSVYWSLLGIDIEDKPAAKLNTLFKFIFKDEDLFLLIDQYVLDLFSSGLNKPDINIILNRQGLILEDFQNLKQRLLCGEYNPAILIILQNLLNPSEYQSLEQTILNINSISKPASFLMVTQAFVLEAYLNIIETLSSLPKEQSLIPLSLWKSNPDYIDTHSVIGNNFCLAQDAYSIQAYWNSIDDSEREARYHQTQARAWISDINKLDSDYRLKDVFSV